MFLLEGIFVFWYHVTVELLLFPFCLRGVTDNTTGFGPVVGGSNPSGDTGVLKRREKA